MRDAQVRAVSPILGGQQDVIIAAATASGKTEAAFLPICSALLAEGESAQRAGRSSAQATASPQAGVNVLYVSPLKALINDQYGRLDALCEHLDLPVHRWHGDVAGSRKAKLVRNPDGLLLITPESLEALMVVHGPKIGHLFGGLRYVVIDELHSFIGRERGAQLQSLLHRAELTIRRRVPRIGLSATLGDMAMAAAFLRPGQGDRVHLIVAGNDEDAPARLQVRGYESVPVKRVPPARGKAARGGAANAGGESEATDGEEAGSQDEVTGDQLAIADHLFTKLRGSDNLVFANSKSEVETYADLLRRCSDRANVPNEFVPHHGSLSKDLREDAEARLKDRTKAATAVCTSTLEMGIDIGSVSSIAQVGAPYSVSSLRQRLGRSGRRGESATLRIYIGEEQVTPQTPPPDALRSQLVQSITMVDLLLLRWNEAPDSGGFHLSTLIQQLLSLMAQHGGVSPLQAHQALCSTGPFSRVTADIFAKLLRALGAADLITQANDGLLLLGLTGERIVNHYSFFTVFHTTDEYRLIAQGRTLGTLPVGYPLLPGSLLIFGGRRWKVLEVDARAKVIELIRSSGGRPPGFTGLVGEIADRVRQEMLTIYGNSDVPAYLDPAAARLLAEGRAIFHRFGLAADQLLAWGGDTLIFPWCGDRIMSTLAAALTATGVETGQDGVCLTLTGTSPAEAAPRLQALAERFPDPLALASKVKDKVVEKYDEFLSEELLDIAYAARGFDIEGARRVLASLLRQQTGEAAAEGALGAGQPLEPEAVAADGAESRDSRGTGGQVTALIAELVELGCEDPAIDCEVSDPATGQRLTIAEACWPEGLQPGQGSPVLLELDPEEANLTRLKELGYEVFTSIESLRGHVRGRVG
ncbi:MAG TPA: DEAD/DEAH box helicase [Streptosporangiaceae bacterium]|nr:DEAD/DEAH box helicase [Streptosporangiaceae bacterium]